MASVKKFPGSAYWYACYKIPTGRYYRNGLAEFRRVQQSTRLTDKDQALQQAISYERAAKAVADKRWAERSAHRFLEELAAVGGVHVAQVEQTEAFLTRWMASKKQTVAPKTLKNFTGIVGDFIKWLGERKTAPLVEVTPRVVADFRDAEMARGKSPATVNKALAVLGQAFEDAVTQMSLERNPARGLRLKRSAQKPQERKPFTFDQFRELVRRTGPGEVSRRGNEVHHDWQTFIITTGYTGGRQQEVAKLTWANVDLANRWIGLGRTKNGDTHRMPMHAALHAHLSSLALARGALAPTAFVMPHLGALTGRKISKIFRETILPRVGISQPYAERTEDKGVGRKLAAYSVHSLRHSLSTWLNEAGVSEMMRMRIVGHEDEGVSRGYTHTELAQVAKELEKIPTL